MTEQHGPAGDASGADAARVSLLAQIAAAGYDEIPVVNSVPEPWAPEPIPMVATSADRRTRRAVARARRKALRVARRSARKRARHPEKFRVTFAHWVAIPWRDRPIEARLSDYAQHLADAIERSIAWRDPLLEDHRIRLDPSRAAAEIGVSAYRLFEIGLQLGERPEGDASSVLEDARATYDAHRASTRSAWNALVDRVLALDAYRDRLIALEPIVRAAETARRLDGARLDRAVAALFSDAARSELASSDTVDLGENVEALAWTLGAALSKADGELARVTAETPAAPPTTPS